MTATIWIEAKVVGCVTIVKVRTTRAVYYAGRATTKIGAKRILTHAADYRRILNMGA